MPYPNPPDWNSSDPLSGWYLSRLSSGTSACSTSGWSLLGSLQSELSGRLSLLGPEPTYDGSTVDASSVPLNDAADPGSAVGWNQAVLRALYAVARAYAIPQSYLAAIQNDAQSGVGPVSPTTFQVGTWIADRIDHRFVQGSSTELYGQGSPDDVQVPSGSSLPRMDAAPPLPPGGTTYGSVCNALSADAASLIPVIQTVSPFRFSQALIFGALAVAVGAVVFMSKDIPVTGRGGVRKNPQGNISGPWEWWPRETMPGIKELPDPINPEYGTLYMVEGDPHKTLFRDETAAVQYARELAERAEGKVTPPRRKRRSARKVRRSTGRGRVRNNPTAEYLGISKHGRYKGFHLYEMESGGNVYVDDGGIPRGARTRRSNADTLKHEIESHWGTRVDLIDIEPGFGSSQVSFDVRPIRHR